MDRLEQIGSEQKRVEHAAGDTRSVSAISVRGFRVTRPAQRRFTTPQPDANGPAGRKALECYQIQGLLGRVKISFVAAGMVKQRGVAASGQRKGQLAQRSAFVAPGFDGFQINLQEPPLIAEKVEGLGGSVQIISDGGGDPLATSSPFFAVGRPV